ncbi:MAG: FGGY family carbohydrate kinase [Porticoccaceae bacterium]|nr:FGGY family carbohydrate kinase [Porticoccaceae bacterium]MDP4752803.1 FGGY family carbohydrate kinase [Porticoccaceae bacterium]MDP4889929.1 FGGY family carbohydrate kinase [Porticoccaceae bacterium]
MQTYILAIDRGSSNLKLVLFNQQGEQVHIVSAPNQETISKEEGWREFDLDIVWQQVCDLTKQIISGFCRSEQIVAVSFSGHGNGLVLLDDTQRPLGNGIYSLDSRAASIVERWKQDGVYSEAQDVFRCPIIAGAPISLFAWIKEYQPDRAGKAKHCLFIKDWLRLCLGGSVATDYTDASSGSLLDHAGQCYSRHIYEKLGVGELYELLPPLHYSSELVAKVSDGAARDSGLKAGTPLFTGGQDLSLGPLGVSDFSEDVLISVFGSWAINVLNVVDTTGLPLVINHPIEGHYLSGVADGNAGLALDTMIRLFFLDVMSDSQRTGKSAQSLLEKIVSANDQNTLLFIPHLFGSMINPGAISGLIGIRSHTERRDIYKAICEGILLGYKANIELLPQFKGIKTVWLIGGGAKSELLAQMMADIFGREVVVPQDSEISARGAAVCALLGRHNGALSSIPSPRIRKRFVPDVAMVHYYEKKSALISQVLLQGDPLLEAVSSF